MQYRNTIAGKNMQDSRWVKEQDKPGKHRSVGKFSDCAKIFSVAT